MPADLANERCRTTRHRTSLEAMPSPDARLTQGTELRALREVRGLSLRELGAACRVTHSFIARLERGEARMPVELLGELSEALGVSGERLRDMFDVCEHCKGSGQRNCKAKKVVAADD